MSNPGVSNHISKLNDEAVRDIRMSRLSFTALAKAYDVSIQTVHAAATGQTWGHIDTPIRSGRKTLRDRILEKVEFDTNGGCWLWTGRKSQTQDRGVIRIDGKGTNASRAAFEAFTGIAPEGGHVCHKCDVSMCVNPDHLYLGDPATNARDRVVRGRCSTTGGGTRKLSPAQVEGMLSLVRDGVSAKRAAAAFGVGTATLRYWKRKKAA